MLSAQAADALDVTLIGSWPSNGFHMEDVAVSGDYAYVGYGNSLTVLSCSDPAHPAWVSNTGTVYSDQIGALALNTPYVYTVGYSPNSKPVIMVADISDPSQPAWVGSSQYNGTPPNDIKLHGQHAYSCGWQSDLNIFSLADPENPLHLVHFTQPLGWYQGVALQGDYLYLADSYGKLHVVNVQDPSNPVAVGQALTTGDAMDVAVHGAHAYLLTSSGLSIMDIQDPTNPTEISFTDLGFSDGIHLNYPLAFVTSISGLHVMDVTDPEHPAEIGYYHYTVPLARSHKITGQGEYLYVVNPDGFFIYRYQPACSTSTPTATPTWSHTATESQPPTSTCTIMSTHSHTPTLTFTATQNPTATPADTLALTSTRSSTPSSTPTLASSPTHSPSATPSFTATAQATPTLSASATATRTQTPTCRHHPRLPENCSVMAYPNPCCRQVQFHWAYPNPISSYIWIYNSNGERVAKISQTDPGQSFSWNTGALCVGIYFVRISLDTENGLVDLPVFKLAIEK